MSDKKILVVEDDSDIAEVIKYNLEKEGYVVLHAGNGKDVFDIVKAQMPAVVILDLMLPGIDGFEVCKILRKNEVTGSIPIIMLSAKSQETDKVVGLELGADDYITKPFSPRELIARIKAVLRRRQNQDNDKRIIAGDIEIDSLKHKVSLMGEKIKLTTTEFKLLSLFARRPGVVFSRDQILSDVFGYNSVVYDRTVDAHIKSLRKKLGKYKDSIETIRGVGYRFKEV